MARLTTRRVAVVSSPGWYGDGGGLYLRVADGGSKQWLFRYIRDKRERQMGLGPVGEPPAGITLAMAAWAGKNEGSTGLGPHIPDDGGSHAGCESWGMEQRQTQGAVACNTCDLRVFHHWSAACVRGGHRGCVLSVLRPIWTAKPETASRLRGRIERVLAYAKTLGLREGENPATWRGHLSEALTSPTKAKRVVGSHRQPFRWRDALTGLPITTHGFRSAFRDWAGETTGYPRGVAEAALAHVIAGRLMTDAMTWAKPIQLWRVLSCRSAMRLQFSFENRLSTGWRRA